MSEEENWSLGGAGRICCLPWIHSRAKQVLLQMNSRWILSEELRGPFANTKTTIWQHRASSRASGQHAALFPVTVRTRIKQRYWCCETRKSQVSELFSTSILMSYLGHVTHGQFIDVKTAAQRPARYRQWWRKGLATHHLSLQTWSPRLTQPGKRPCWDTAGTNPRNSWSAGEGSKFPITQVSPQRLGTLLILRLGAPHPPAGWAGQRLRTPNPSRRQHPQHQVSPCLLSSGNKPSEGRKRVLGRENGFFFKIKRNHKGDHKLSFRNSNTHTIV